MATPKKDPFDSYSDASYTDAAGRWDPEDGPIHCIPLGVKLLDNKLNKNSPSALVFVRLVDSCQIKVKKGEDTETVTADPGTIVAVWYKPGMKGLEMAFGRKTAMRLNPKKNQDTGKGNDMIGFDVKCDPNSKPARLPVFEDAREKSKGASSIFLVGQGSKPKEEGPTEEDMGEIPFG